MGAGVRTGAVAAFAAAALALATLAAPAAADRAPDRAELEEMAGAAGPPVDPDCVEGRISTVDARWGALFAKGGEGCQRPPYVWVLRRPEPGTPGGRWSEVGQGARFGVCARELRRIPDAAGLDLDVCAPPSRRAFAPSGRRFAFKPRTLPWGASARVAGLRWSRWGGAKAVGRGTFVYADRHGDGFRAPVVVTLSALGLCGSDRTYLAKELRAVRTADAAAVRPYKARWFVQCPGVISTPGR
ncbi:hypothetical protein [Conexibacter arvalis]|uniref:Uncharacterized protein n=1 Tax=Conexibacter arvalis TaxID=912552 RepID=A0A840IMF6_9ACTN|nr:hypothetical protein [Conexibacter arvalis]MBB4665040.1 hypothetical protein [Conexibacter arvalis]